MSAAPGFPESSLRGIGQAESAGGGPGLVLLRTVADAAPALISYIDTGFVYRLANHAYERWFGQRADVIVGRHVREVLGEAAWGRVRPYMERAAGGEEVTYEAELPYRDGGARWVRVSYTPDRDEAGTVRGFVVLVVEIGEQKRLEAELRRGEALFRSCLDGLVDAVGIYSSIRDEGGRIVDFRVEYVNEAAARGNRYAREEQIGRRVLEILPGHAETGLLEHYKRVVETGEPFAADSFEFVMPWEGDEARRWFAIRASKFGDGFTASWRDVTRRHEAEARVRRSERLYRAIGESIDYGIWVCDAEGRNTYVSPSFLNLLGITQEQCSEFGWGEALHPDEAAATMESWRACVASGSVWERSHRFRGRDGREYHILARGVPIRDESGRIECWAGINLDISGLKRTERALTESSERLAVTQEWMRQALEAGGIVAWTWDLRSGRVECSEGAEAMFGMRAGPVEGFLASMHAEDAPRVEAWQAAVLRGEMAGEHEFRVQRGDGAWRWVMGQGRLERDAAGAPVRVVGTTIDIDARKRAETAMRESNERFSIAQLATRLGVYDYDYRADRNVWSAEIEALYGLRPGEFEGRYEDWLKRVHPEDRERAARDMEESSASGEYSSDFRVVWPDGTVRWIYARARVLTDSDGTPRRMLGVNVDITERKAAERALQESEARFRRLYEANVVGMVHGDFEGRILEANDEFLRIVGYTREDLREGRLDWRVLTPPEHLQKDLDSMPELLRTGRHTPFEKEYTRKDGSRVPVLIGTAYLGGPPATAFSTVVDLTPMRQAEQAIRESEERFRALADASSVLIWVNGRDGGCELVNRAYLEFFGRTMEEVRGFAWVPSLHPEDAAAYVEEYQRAFEDRRPFRGEVRMRRADGAYRWIQSEARPRFTEGGEFMGVVGSSVDITDVMEAREFLQRRQEEMERLVRERTAELESSHARLRFSERMATIGTLSAGLGHDMGNLLLPIRERLEAMREREPGAETLGDLESIGRCVEYLTRMTQGLRLLAVAPEERTGAGAETTELREWWAQAEPVLKNAVPRGVSLVGRLGAGPVGVQIGRAALTQAVFNLVQNAGDVLRGRTDGEVAVWADELAGGRVRIGVSDNGPGMTEEVRRRCMEPFFTTKTRGLSTGLGLALVHGIVQRAGGSVSIETAPGSGTVFVLTMQGAEVGTRGGTRAVRAAVSLREARTRAFVGSLLQAHGVELTGEAEPEGTGAALWIADASSESIARGEAFVGSGSGRRVVLVGEAPSDKGVPGVAVVRAMAFADLREALTEAICWSFGAGGRGGVAGEEE